MKHFSRLLALLLAVCLLPLTFMAAASAEEDLYGSRVRGGTRDHHDLGLRP